MGHEPRMSRRDNVGYDVLSRTPDGLRFIEVKGRAEGATTVTVTRNEIQTCLNEPDKYWLAVVGVHGRSGGSARLPCRAVPRPRPVRGDLGQLLDQRPVHVTAELETPLDTKKLIEVALPLEAINAASAREKAIRHGHPSTLHLWWARRPLAACRAVLFASLVDDPSSDPDGSRP